MKSLYTFIAVMLPLAAAAAPLDAGATRPNSAALVGELPSSAVHPEGWLKEFLARQISGLTGHPAAMGFPFNQQMWAAPLDVKDRQFSQFGTDWWPYEQTAYYVDGALRCAYLMRDEALLAAARRSLDAVVGHPKANGRLGPANVDNDSWPMVVFMRALLEEYENTGERKLLDAIEHHYAAIYPDKDRLPALKLTGFNQRSVLHAENLCRLAKLTGNPDYATLAARIYQKFCEDNPTDGKTPANMLKGAVEHEHAVTYQEFLKLPALLHSATGDASYLRAAERGFAMLEASHELADGLSSGHEGLAGQRSDKVHETCTATDFIWTCGYMLEATGQAKWADKIEKVLFNAGFGALTKDFKAHQYYSGPNQVVLTGKSSHWNLDQDWGWMATGRMCYRPGHDTECCSGNIHRLLPAFIKRMWLVDNAAPGVTAALYSPCQASFQLAQGPPLTIAERTNYPFEQRIEFVFATATPQLLTFRMRIPGWSKGFKVLCNGRAVDLTATPEGFVSLHREFRDGDRVELGLEAQPVIRRSGPGASISYGALVFSLPVTAKVTTLTDLPKSSPQFPAYEMLPISQWNYALPATLSASQVQVVTRPPAGYPWDAGASPVVLRVSGRTATNWTLGDKPYTPDIPEHVTTTGDEHLLELVPLGSTLLRVTEFPRE